MFTGIVEALGEVAEMREDGPGVRMSVCVENLAADAKIGDSIAVNGCCLTVVDVQPQQKSFAFEAGGETLRRTNIGRLRAGSWVNLEASLKAGDRLGGHFVTGHIDGPGKLIERIDDHDWSTFWFDAPTPLLQQMAGKGSIAVDGVSLTLVDVADDRFSVALIPHTLSVTTLGRLQAGDAVNLETDVLAKYVEKQLAGR